MRVGVKASGPGRTGARENGHWRLGGGGAGQLDQVCVEGRASRACDGSGVRGEQRKVSRLMTASRYHVV